jgi:hypothetical protein
MGPKVLYEVLDSLLGSRLGAMAFVGLTSFG